MPAKEEQRKERDFIDSIFKTAPVIILVLDDHGRVVSFNPYLEKISGYKLEEAKGEYWFDIFVPERERDRIRGVFKDTSREIETTGTMNPILTRDGREVMIEWSNRPIKDDDGSLVWILAIGQDITERMLAEDAIRESEERFRRLSDAAEEGIAIHDQGVIVDANEALARMFGYELEELIGMYAEKLATPETWQTILKNITAGYDKPYEGIGVRKDGSTFVCQLAGKPYQYQGKTLRVAAFRDITTLKKTEEALRESEEKYRLVVENAGEGIVVYQDGELKYYNKKIVEIMGYTEEEYASIDHISLLHPDDKEIALERYRKRHRGEEVPDSYEVRILCKNGETKWVTVIPVVMTWQDKPATLTFIIDITERKQAEETMVRLQKLESLSVLAGGIAHDFNNLLMGILGYAELAKAELGPESPGRNSVERIEESALLAADITKQMLAYSGKGKFVIEPINLSRLIAEMTHLLEAVVSKKSVLKFNLEGELPAVDADATQLRQVVLNLVTNASEAIGDRSGVINVTTGVMECDADYLVATYLKEEMEAGIYSYLEVSDTGCGMDEEMRAKIFDPFFTTKFAGRGLGLAAVLGIIRGHKGAIKVDSAPGRGSTFRLLFPISTETAKEKADTGEQPVDSRISGTILVVDDEESIRALAKLVLEKSGVKVLTAEDGRKGVEIFRKHQDEISVVVLDMTMPHMGGEETFNEIKKIRKDVRVILSSGYDEQQVTSGFVGKGLAGFIQKPYRPSELIEKLRQLFKD